MIQSLSKSIQSKRIVFLTLLLCALFFIASAVPLLASRTLGRVKVTGPSGQKITEYAGSYALLIGESKYHNGWDSLDSIPAEIAAVEKMLQKRGFQVETHHDLDSKGLEKAYSGFIDKYGYDENNRLLFFFSGHGYSMNNGKRGYLVPVDAPSPLEDKKGFQRKALGMNQILSWSRDMVAKHGLFLFDSCFSGTIFKARSLPPVPPNLSQLMASPVRQYITAGSAGEEVPATSTFTPAFVDGLEHGLADLNRDGFISGTELGLYLRDEVPKYARQHPQFGKINDYELARGDFLFLAGGSAVVEQEALQVVHDQSSQAPGMGSLEVSTTPSGAEIAIDGIFEGTSPLKVKSLASGVITVQAEKAGFRLKQKKVRIREGRKSELTLILDKINLKSSLTIQPTPSDATVRILNITPKYTPGMELDPGNYMVEVSRSGYTTKTHEITLASGEDLDIPVHLQQLPKPLGPSPGDTWKEPTTGMEFVYIKGGCFQMGMSSENKQQVIAEAGQQIYDEYFEDKMHQHEVCVDGFWIARYEVTNKQYRRYKSGHDSKSYKGKSLNGENQPAVYVSWEDATDYARWLSGKSSKIFGLPKEAQWEYAARGGTSTMRYWGDAADRGCDYLNIIDQSAKRELSLSGKFNCDDGYTVTSPVGSFKPNRYGLYDMLGNVSEWCSDWYDRYYYKRSPRSNPSGASVGVNHVIRGGSWSALPFGVGSVIRSSGSRSFSTSSFPLNDLGFRLVFSEGSR